MQVDQLGFDQRFPARHDKRALAEATFGAQLMSAAAGSFL